PGALLPKLDVATMAVSLEARSPWLDHEFVEAVASIPTNFKVGKGGAKRLLRDAFSRTLPLPLLDGPKRGFGLPLDSWFRGALAPVSRALLTGPEAAINRFLRPAVVERVLSANAAGRGRH